MDRPPIDSPHPTRKTHSRFYALFQNQEEVRSRFRSGEPDICGAERQLVDVSGLDSRFRSGEPDVDIHA
jgi:hypothetical protein